MKKVLPIILFGTMSLIFIGGILTPGTKPEPGLLIMPLIMIVFGILLFWTLVWDLADEVKDAGDYLLVRKSGVEIKVFFTEIINVSITQSTNPSRLTLRLKKSGKLGDEIVFIPLPNSTFIPFTGNPMAEDLMKRVYTARRNH